MKKCKCCGTKVPKSRTSSEYCLECEDAIEKHIRVAKAARKKMTKDMADDFVKEGEEIIRDIRNGFQDVLKDAEKMLKGLRKMLDK